MFKEEEKKPSATQKNRKTSEMNVGTRTLDNVSTHTVYTLPLPGYTLPPSPKGPGIRDSLTAPTPPPFNRLPDTCENITFPQIRYRSVMIFKITTHFMEINVMISKYPLKECH